MIDFIRIENLEPSNLKYSNCTQTDCYTSMNIDTGELANKERSYELGLKASTNKIEGSIHKYFSNIT